MITSMSGFKDLSRSSSSMPTSRACRYSSRPRQCRFASPARCRRPFPGPEHIVFVLEMSRSDCRYPSSSSTISSLPRGLLRASFLNQRSVSPPCTKMRFAPGAAFSKPLPAPCQQREVVVFAHGVSAFFTAPSPGQAPIPRAHARERPRQAETQSFCRFLILSQFRREVSLS